MVPLCLSLACCLCTQSLHFTSVVFYHVFFRAAFVLNVATRCDTSQCFLLNLQSFLCLNFSSNDCDNQTPKRIMVNLSIRTGSIQLGNRIQIWFWAMALCLWRAGILSLGCAIVFRRSGLLSLDQVFCACRLTRPSNPEQIPAQRYDRKWCIKTLRGAKFKVCSFVNILTGNCI